MRNSDIFKHLHDLHTIGAPTNGDTGEEYV